jgi:two-component system, response regulator
MQIPSDPIAGRPILYVEDDADDIASMERAFARVGIKNPLHCIGDINDAFARIGRKSTGADTVGAALVLLDLSLPSGSGFELLKRIRTSPAASTVPVIVVTGSHDESDIRRAAMLGANGYLVKPDKPELLIQIVTTIRDYWLGNDQFARQATGISFREIRPVVIE